ncbi:MAG: hypothetical protein WBO19_13465 [Terriglobia bacterium]
MGANFLDIYTNRAPRSDSNQCQSAGIRDAEAQTAGVMWEGDLWLAIVLILIANLSRLYFEVSTEKDSQCDSALHESPAVILEVKARGTSDFNRGKDVTPIPLGQLRRVKAHPPNVDAV